MAIKNYIVGLGIGLGVAGTLALSNVKSKNEESELVRKLNEDAREENFGESNNEALVYVVKGGDTLGGIAKSYGVGLDLIMELNPGIKNPNRIRVGQEIYLSQDSNSLEGRIGKGDSKNESVSGEPIFYTIQKGDNYEKIQINENLKRGVLLELNPNTNPRRLQIGQKIVIGYGGKMHESQKRNLFPNDSDEKFLARMLFGEVRGESDFEKYQVAYSAINRVNDGIYWNGRNLREVLNLETMYSCFNEGDDNWPLVNNPEKHDKNSWLKCQEIAKDVLSKNPKYPDMTKGATHYHNPRTSNPRWKNGMDKVPISRVVHDFYIPRGNRANAGGEKR